MLEACVMLSSQFYATRQNSDIVQLAENMLKKKTTFSDEEKFRDSLSAVTTFMLRAKEFTKADPIIEENGLPCDPSVCLT